MGAPRKRVWELVHSLTSSESQKFYDRAFEYKRGQYSNYVILYDALKAQIEFDDKALKETLKGQPFLGHLHRIKNYLYDKILEFVRDARVDGESELYSKLENIKFLFEKRLFHHLPDHLEKTEMQALALEDFQAQLKVFHYRRELLAKRKDWESFKNDISELRNRELQLIELESEKIHLTHLRDQSLELGFSKESQTQISLIQDEIDKIGTPKSLTSNILLSRIKYNLERAKGRFHECITHTDNIVSIFQNNPSLIQDYSNFNTFVISAFFGASYRVLFNQFPEAEKTFELIQSVGQTRKREPAMYFEKKILFDLTLGRQKLDYNLIKLALTSYQKIPQSIRLRIDPASDVKIHHIATICLILFDSPKEALQYNLRIRGIGSADTKPSFKDYARILFIVSHYELENYDIVEQGIKSARIAFARRKSKSPFYSSVFHLFSQMIKARTQSELEKSIRTFLVNYESNDSIWNVMDNYFNLSIWLRSKIASSSFAELLKKEFSEAH